MRLFVAAVPPEAMLEALAETSAALRDAVRGRYVAPDSFHVTLAFLGSVEVALLPEVEGAMAEACRGHGSIEATLGSLGSFGRARRATLWQGVESHGALEALARDLRAGLRERGMPYDDRGFLAHVTLMRSADLAGGVLPMPRIAGGGIDGLTLFRSDLTGPAPAYEELCRVPLGGGGWRAEGGGADP